MAPKVRNTKHDAHPKNQHYRRTNNINKSKTFLTRINYEKLLPFKKRLFLIEFKIKKQHFQPTPYEKPVTRSQQGRFSTLNSTNKENRNILSDDLKKRNISRRSRKQNGKTSVQSNIQHGNSMSTINEDSLKQPTTDIDAGGNGANICAVL